MVSTDQFTVLNIEVLTLMNQLMSLICKFFKVESDIVAVARFPPVSCFFFLSFFSSWLSSNVADQTEQ